MSESETEQKKRKRDDDGEKLPPQWQKIHGAIWLIGLAILFWQGWIFPGILVLVALSSLLEVGMRLYLKRQEETATLEAVREMHLPENCPNCGGPISTATVQWRGPQTAICPFCASTIKAVDATRTAP